MPDYCSELSKCLCFEAYSIGFVRKKLKKLVPHIRSYFDLVLGYGCSGTNEICSRNGVIEDWMVYFYFFYSVGAVKNYERM